MNVFEKNLLKKDEMVRRRVYIDTALYNELEKLTKTYDASINKMINIAIMELINTENITIYPKPEKGKIKEHNICIRSKYYEELRKMKNKYGLSIFKLINIAIYNAINS